MNKPHYEIFIRDTNFRTIGVIKRFSNLQLTRKYNDIGSFSITMVDDGSVDTELMKRIFTCNGGYGGIIVTRNSKIIFSGFTREMEATGDYMSRGDQKQIVFRGWDDTGLLASRIMMVKRQPGIPGVPDNDSPRQFVAPSGQGGGR